MKLFLPIIVVSLGCGSVVAKLDYSDESEPLEVLGLAFPPRNAVKPNRSLRHTIPPLITPRRCKYNFSHDWNAGVLTDEIHCPDWCGVGRDFTLSVSTVVGSDGTSTSYADCYLPACNKCERGTLAPGQCECPYITSFAAVCDSICNAVLVEQETTNNPTPEPTVSPSAAPTLAPTPTPTDAPSDPPTSNPTVTPTDTPTARPSVAPSDAPSIVPSTSPSDAPSHVPSLAPSDSPSIVPSTAPSDAPSFVPTPNANEGNSTEVVGEDGLPATIIENWRDLFWWIYDNVLERWISNNNK